MAMTITNQTNQDYWFGPLHLPAGVGRTLDVDDTDETSLYLTNDTVADAINSLLTAGKITVTGAAAGFPRATGVPQLLHGDGSPEGIVYAVQGSLYLRRDSSGGAGQLYQKATGVHVNTDWISIVGTPTGAVQAYGGASPPIGWLLCDGSPVSRTDYADLFGVIGTTYGVGDGSTTFNVPDMRGRVAAGFAASGGHPDVSVLGNNEGPVSLPNRRPKHRHSVTDPGHVHSALYSLALPGGSAPTGYLTTNASGSGNVHDHNDSAIEGSASTGITVGASTDSLDAPGYVILNFIIKT